MGEPTSENAPKPAPHLNQKLLEEPIGQFFAYEHLRPDLKVMSAWFAVLAEQVAEGLPRNAERTVCLRKLLEAKDAAVRAALFVEPKKRDGGF